MSGSELRNRKETKELPGSLNCKKRLVRRAGIEPAQPLRAEGF